jgi:tRNA(adenine34) deaminase
LEQEQASENRGMSPNDGARDRYWMEHALALAAHGETREEVPVGAVVVLDDATAGEGWNQPIGRHDPTAHAEVVALRAAGARLGNYRLSRTTLYVTLEPCLMCVGAILHARVARLVYGATDPKGGAVCSLCRGLELPGLNHRVEVTGGVLAGDCGELLQRFFRARRGNSGLRTS